MGGWERELNLHLDEWIEWIGSPASHSYKVSHQNNTKFIWDAFSLNSCRLLSVQFIHYNMYNDWSDKTICHTNTYVGSNSADNSRGEVSRTKQMYMLGSNGIYIFSKRTFHDPSYLELIFIFAFHFHTSFFFPNPLKEHCCCSGGWCFALLPLQLVASWCMPPIRPIPYWPLNGIKYRFVYTQKTINAK